MIQGNYITTDKLKSLGYDLQPDLYVIFDRAAEHGGVSMPSGWGATEEEARADVLNTAEQARVDPERLNGECYKVLQSMPW